MSEKKLPYTRKPEDLTVEEWQAGLRKQYAKDQKFKFSNIGDHPVYSDFEVFNPISNNTYKVSLRDGIDSYNFCSCPDFKVNTLGTCKHIEYLLHYFSQYKKYQKYLLNPSNPDLSSLSVYYGSKRTIRLEKSSKIDFFDEEKELFDENGFLKVMEPDLLEKFIEKAKIKDPGFEVYEDTKVYIDQAQKIKSVKQIASGLFSEGVDSTIFNTLIHTELYPYQKAGVQKIVETGRILVGDEMGLGKTIQAIAATEIFASHFGVKKVLIICPTSLKYQWKREIEKFSDKDAVIVEGLRHVRKDLYMNQTFYKIISYGVCRNDLEWINKFSPDLVIIDEAQRIKNWKTQTAQSVKKIESEYAIVLTGTPLENKIDELHSIVEYIDKYKLGPLFRFLDNHQIVDEFGKLKGYRDLKSIHKTLDDIILRRTKKEIIDQLPGRIDKNYFVELTKEQQEDHKSYYDIVCQLVNKWIRTGTLSEKDRERLLLSLNCMRMVCDSTYILNQKTNHGNKIDELSELIDELLEDQNNKIVIFSQWKRMFDLVVKELEKRGIQFVYLNGDIPAKQRNQIITTFQKQPEVKIFLSTDAGGVGVNLQKANILINLDLPWNPAVLEQRIGRIYRLGQKKYVNIFNFIAKSSIEHRILHLLEFKKSVFAGTIDGEGKDEIMLESFLESVKSLTEVDLDERYTMEQEVNRIKRPGHHDAIAEDINNSVLAQYPDMQERFDERRNRTHARDGAAGKAKGGLFAKIKKGFLKLFRR